VARPLQTVEIMDRKRHALTPEIFAPWLLGAVAIALGGCNALDGDRTQPESTAGASPQSEVDIDDLQDDPTEYVGREVRIVGEIDDPSHGDHAFVVDGDDWFFADEVLVLGTTPMRLGGEHLVDGDDVVVIGTVWVGDMPGLERELGWPIREGMADDWEDEAVIVAHTVRRADDGAVWTAPGHADQ
jgi:hypothetical protein